MNSVTVYILADGEVFREGLVASLGGQDGIEMVGHAGSLDEMVAEGKFAGADVLVVDADILTEANSGVLNGSSEQFLHELRVLFLGNRQDEQNLRAEDVPAYMALETVGFILKSSRAELMAHTVKLLAAGIFVCEASLIKRMLTRLVEWSSYGTVEQDQQLSGRETEVLRRVGQGWSYREIAQELFVAEGTIRAHVSHLMAKLGLRRRSELIRYALACGLVPASNE